MTTIKRISRDNILTGIADREETDMTIGEWLVAEYHGTSQAFTVFRGQPCAANDITQDIDALTEGRGEYTVVETPSTGLEPAAWIAIVSLVISVAAIVFAPKPKIPGNISRNQESPNNALGARTNQPRPLQRIPDIKGTVRAIPDVIGLPYSVYESKFKKVEYGYYCVGRKRLSLADIRDGGTPLSLIASDSAQVYFPSNSPNNGTNVPDVQVGPYFDEDVVAAYRDSQIKNLSLTFGGQYSITTIDAGSGLNAQVNASGSNTIITIRRIGEIDWLSDDWKAGTTITLTNFAALAIFSWAMVVDMSGTYEILALTHTDGTNVYDIEIAFDLAAAVGAGPTPAEGGVLTGSTLALVAFGQIFYQTRALFDKAIFNVSAPNGLWRDTGTASLREISISYRITIDLLDSNNEVTGSPIVIDETISGASQLIAGKTTAHTFSAPTKFRASIRRVTEKIAQSGAISQNIEWEDFYGIKFIGKTDFGNITTIQTKTDLSSQSNITRERELNCLATEMLNVYEGGGVFAGALTTNASAVQSYIADFIDPVFGNRPLAELDADGLLAMDTAITTYFGSSDYNQFNFTIDSTDVTFQEYTQLLFNAIFSIAYREASLVRAHFERPQTIPAMLFTHRSKIPDSETYSRNFNFSQINDGVEFKWTNPATDTQEVVYIPTDRSAANPKRLEMAGFRNLNQATKRAWREYRKVQHEKISLALETTADGQYVKPGELISVVKGTRSNTFDGEVLAVSESGLILTLSQDVVFGAGLHSIILKSDDGTTEAINCTAGSAANIVALDSLPAQPIRTGITTQRRTEFSFGNDDRHNGQLFIARSIDTGKKHSVNITAVNYTNDYYSEDLT